MGEGDMSHKSYTDVITPSQKFSMYSVSMSTYNVSHASQTNNNTRTFPLFKQF